MSRSNSLRSVAATALMVVSLLAASGAQATLFTRLNGKAVYDDQANLTWLQDANYAQTSGYDDDGLMTWDDAMSWAGSLNIDEVRGWRLPGGPYDEYWWWSNELSILTRSLCYQDYVNAPGLFCPGFANVRPRGYWTNNVVEVLEEPDRARVIVTMPIYDFVNQKDSYWSAWAVHDGDVGDVPAPGTLALLGAGLLGWIGVKRRA